MRKPKIRIDFSKKKDAELSDYATNIVTRMTGNTNFTTPAPTLASITTLITNFDKARDKAINGSTIDTSAKNAQRVLLESALAALGLYVQLTSGNDITKMLSSGFQLHKQPAAIGDLPAPSYFKVLVDNDVQGKVTLDQATQIGAEYYMWLYLEGEAPDDDESWNYQISVGHKIDITSLTSGAKYAFKGAAVSSTGNATFSNPVSRYIQ